MRALTALVVLSLVAAGVPWSIAEARSAARPRAALSQEAPEQKAPSGSCCKTCRKGKACGDSCISRAYACHQPPGCACDAE